MSYELNGTSQYITANSGLGNSYPYTLSVFFNKTTTANEGCAISINDTSVTNTYISALIDTALKAQEGNTGGFARASQSGVNANTWSNAAVQFISSSSRVAYLNASKTSNATASSLDLSLLSVISIGALRRFAVGAYFGGIISDAAIWNVALTDDEVTSLAKGFKPTRIRPQSLVFYAPLIRDLNEVKGALTLTNNNSATVADHPRVY